MRCLSCYFQLSHTEGELCVDVQRSQVVDEVKERGVWILNSITFKRGGFGRSFFCLLRLRITPVEFTIFATETFGLH